MRSRKRILLIDHEPGLTALVSSALEASGRYVIQQERYGRRALRVALHFRPDLVLVDAKPDHLEIDDVAQEIHAERELRDVPVLCLSSLAGNGQIGTIGFLSGYTFLANPFHLEDMVNCIGEILRRKQRA